jgi:enamine deaminase RidA (YjgF/YER057c/UK114 family)
MTAADIPNRQYVPATGPWADMLGYSRAVRDGDHIWISATAPVDSHGQIVGVGNAYAQTRHILSIIESALRETGALMRDVVRTRLYIRSFADIGAIGQAHQEAFPGTPPACSVIAVADLVLADMLVYIEAEAIARVAAR